MFCQLAALEVVWHAVKERFAKGKLEELKMIKVIHGKVHGRTIELAEDLGLAEGQDVEVAVRTLPASPTRTPGEGFVRTEGALADDPHWDGIMAEVHRSRKLERRSPLEES
jgi:hypothetical protein